MVATAAANYNNNPRGSGRKVFRNVVSYADGDEGATALDAGIVVLDPANVLTEPKNPFQSYDDLDAPEDDLRLIKSVGSDGAYGFLTDDEDDGICDVDSTFFHMVDDNWQDVDGEHSEVFHDCVDDADRIQDEVPAPFAISQAVPIAPPVAAPSAGSQPLHLSAYDSETLEAIPLGHSRPGFIQIKVHKPYKFHALGLSLQRRDGKVLVHSIDPNGILGKSKAAAQLQPGDHIVSVNGVSCMKKCARQVVLMLKASAGDVSIVARNEQGDPSLVVSCVPKAREDQLVGVALRQTRGALVVSRVKPDGLFAGTLLMAGHRCVEINGVKCGMMVPEDAADLISKSPDYVTISSSPRDVTKAMVLAGTSSTRKFIGADPVWWKHFIATTGLTQFQRNGGAAKTA